MSDDELPNVSNVYNRIFKNDPFLIDEDHQRDFGIQIARNLLVERSISASEPAEISLHAPMSRMRFKETRHSPPPLQDPALEKHYWQARTNRAGVEKDNLERLSDYTMVARGELTSDRRGDRIENDYTATNDLKTSGSPLSARLKFAAIGYRVPISKLSDPTLSEDLHPLPVIDAQNDFRVGDFSKSTEGPGVRKLRRTAQTEMIDIPQWRSIVERHVAAALRSGAQFIVLPEFGLPPDDTGWSALAAFEEIASQSQSDPATQGTPSSEFLLFSGTRHEGAFNRGFLLVRGKESPKPPGAWWHYKVASARSLGENIMGPQSHKLPSYTLNLTPPNPPDAPEAVKQMRCKVYVAVCYDVFDPTTFINYVIQCASKDKDAYDNLILVPSFNPGSDFHHALRDLSFVGNCPILYVNALHGDSKLFLFGFDVLDILEFEEKRQPVVLI